MTLTRNIETQAIAAEIGNFFLENNNHDYEKTEKQILGIGITKLEVVGCSKDGEQWYEATITTNRPGLLIGRRGTTVDALIKYLRERHGEKFQLTIKEDEDNLHYHLVPIHPDFYF